MLLKPTPGVPARPAGFLFDERLFGITIYSRLIAEGCQYDSAARVARLEVFPSSPIIDR